MNVYNRVEESMAMALAMAIAITITIAISEQCDNLRIEYIDSIKELEHQLFPL
jgi:hypothetical protein